MFPLVDHVRRKLVFPLVDHVNSSGRFRLAFVAWRFPAGGLPFVLPFRPGVSAFLFRTAGGLPDRFQLSDGRRTVSREFSESFELSDNFQNCLKMRHNTPNRQKIGFLVKIGDFWFDMPNRGKKSQKIGPGIFTGSIGGKSWYNPIRTRKSRSRAATGSPHLTYRQSRQVHTDPSLHIRRISSRYNPPYICIPAHKDLPAQVHTP